MKKYLIIFTFSFAFAIQNQKAQSTIKATCTSIDVEAGTHHLFTDASHKRELTFTLDGNGELKGEITIKIHKTNEVIFRGNLKGEYLVDSAMWFDGGRLIKKTIFNSTCCANYSDYVEPSPKHLTCIKGQREGNEIEYYTFNPDFLHYKNSYEGGKKSGKQHEFDSTGTLLHKRTYKEGKLQDTSWLNCGNPTADIEIYNAGLPAGTWKKYDGSGTLIEEIYHLEKGDSTISYAGPGMINSIFYKSDALTDAHYCREYDGKPTLLKQYFLKDRWDTTASYYEGTYLEFDSLGRKLKVANYSFSRLNGDYEEYVNGKISKKGKYFHDEQIGTWFNYNAKGKVTSSEQFKNKEDIIIDAPIFTPEIKKDVALNMFPAAIVKPTITMVLAPNGKIGKLIKKYPDIEWSFHVKTPSSHEAICDDARLSAKEKDDVQKYLKVSITTVKTIHYDHKEVPFVMHYKLSQ